VRYKWKSRTILDQISRNKTKTAQNIMKKLWNNQQRIRVWSHLLPSIPDRVSIPKMLVEKPFNIIRQFQHGLNTDLNTFWRDSWHRCRREFWTGGGVNNPGTTPSYSSENVAAATACLLPYTWLSMGPICTLPKSFYWVVERGISGSICNSLESR